MMKSKLLGGIASLATVAIVASGAVVAQDAIAQRKALMKVVGSSAKTGADMAKGSVPFDAAKAGEAMGAIAANWQAFVKLFPAGSGTGGETTASPKIWETLKDFEDKGAKFAANATAAQKAAATGADAFKAAFGEVQKGCGDCHRVYREKK